jgi:signal transduction histidine kinase
MPPEDAKGMLDALQPVFAERAPFYSLRHTVRHREGHLLTLECSAVPIFDREGRFGGYRGISRDVTERKKMEMELLKAKKLESVGFLAGGIAHDFNNLLQVILGNISLAKEFETSDERIRQLLERAETASLQASDLTKRLITFSKGGTPIKETVYIGDLIRDTVLSTLSSPKVTCEFNIADDLWPVAADKGQIRQVIGNIVLNAQEAMPEGGILTILAENSEVCAEQDLSLAAGWYIKISIKDSGIGIPKENLARMFDPYFTTKEVGPQKGKGLGLAIAYSIIKKHDGLITVESQVGEGTTFFIYLPAPAKRNAVRKESH